MAKKKRKKAKKSEKSSGQKGTTKAKTPARKAPKGYKRGDLGKAIYAYFDKVGIDNAKYKDALAVALKVLPSTKFNEYHFSWYKNQYNLKQE